MIFVFYGLVCRMLSTSTYLSLLDLQPSSQAGRQALRKASSSSPKGRTLLHEPAVNVELDGAGGVLEAVLVEANGRSKGRRASLVWV